MSKGRIIYQGVVMTPQLVTIKAYTPKDAIKSVHNSFESVQVKDEDGTPTTYPPKLLELRDTGERIPDPQPWTPPKIA